jgi:AcrR family transcriptional regulator
MVTEHAKGAERSDNRRKAIILAAVRTIRLRGVEGMRMRDVARDVGLSTGNLYYYFRNKHELLYHCQDHALDLLLEQAAYASANRAMPARMSALVEGHLRVVLGLGAIAHLDIDGLPKQMHKKLVEKRDLYQRTVVNVISNGQRHKQFREGHPLIRAQLIFGAIDGLSRWYRPSPNEAQEIDVIIKTFREQLMRGLVWTRD